MSMPPATSRTTPILRSNRDPSDDPFGLVPASFPPHPRVLCTVADIQRTRDWASHVEWVGISIKRLCDSADEATDIPSCLPNPRNVAVNNALANNTLKQALAYALTGEPRFLDRALRGFRVFAAGYLVLPVVSGSSNRAGGGGLSEARLNITVARTYDLLAATSLTPEDDALFRAMLEETYDTISRGQHRTCGNHRTWDLTARVAVASALGDRLGLHEALYGSPSPVPRAGVPEWAYGLVHQLGHDVLSDGQHWERTPGYHFYTLMAFTDTAEMFANLGVDLWNARLPATMESSGFDLHRDYGPEGTRTLKAAFDAPFYQAFSNGDYSQLHDSGLANLRGAYIWGTLYESAYHAYGDPKYAWLLNKIEQDYPVGHAERAIAGLPMGLQPNRGDLDFVRVRVASVPRGAFSFSEDADISQTGRHRRGCTIFPAAGVTVLRADVHEASSPGAYLFWGPHSAGHQSPGGLHLDLHAHGRPLTTAPSAGGYDDNAYLTWVRHTISHNTVTVDRRPMFPYDLPTDSIWEADGWRRWNSDGVSELFQPGTPADGYHAMRASNQALYPGVRLDRTVVLTNDYAIDCYRVFSDAPHEYEYALHILGKPDIADIATAPIDMGDARGYMHLTNARTLTHKHGVLGLDWTNTIQNDARRISLQMIAPVGASVILADPPQGGKKHGLGELHSCAERFTLVTRVSASRTVFITLWSFNPTACPAVIEGFAGNADTPITLTVGHQGKSRRWILPVQNQSI